MADWEEVKRLAADFQKVQLGSTTQRLSERNWIEIISWLKDKKMVDLIFTFDGKECLTHEQLVKDILNELYASGGRIELTNVAKNIGVDLTHIINHVGSVLKTQKSLCSVLGQLIEASYLDKMIGEINDKLSQQGQINVSELTVQYSLPSDFLQTILEKNLGKLLIGKQDPNDSRVFFNESFIARSVGRIRGALLGLMNPTPVTIILNQIDISDKLFFTLFDQASVSGTLTSRMIGAQYIPTIYAKSQKEWIHTFFAQNEFLEYEALKRAGVSDYRSYVTNQFPKKTILVLDSCVISNEILDRLLDEIEECVTSRSFTEVYSFLPSVFNDVDITLLMEMVMNAQRNLQIIRLQNYVISLTFIEDLMERCTEKMEDNVKKCVENGSYKDFKMKSILGSHLKSQKSVEFDEKIDKREERRKKAAGGKSGGGTQGRETKTKSTKKPKGNARNVDTEVVEHPETKPTLEIVSNQDVTNCIMEKLQDVGLSLLIPDFVEYIQPRLEQKALAMAEEIYVTTVADRTASRRQTHNELQQKLNNLIGDVRLFEKGIKLVPQDLQTTLYKYLLKTSCADIVTEILGYVAHENNSTPNLSNNELRLKFVSELPEAQRASLLPLVKSLSSSNVDEFMGSVEDALVSCSMILKKIDKKKDRVIVLNHRHELLEQLNKCDDLAIMLHLVVLVIFTTATQCMLHASGKHLQQLLRFLKQYLSPEQIKELNTYHDYVGLMLSGGSEVENVREKLKEMVPVIRGIANDFKKPATEKS